MANDFVFAEGLFVKKKEDAPEYVLCDLSIEVEEFKAFMDKNSFNGKVRLNVMLSKAGKPYAKLDTYNMNRDKENAQQQQEEAPEAPTFEPPPLIPVTPSFQPTVEPQDQDIPF